MRLADNLHAVQEKIAEAAIRAGRRPGDINLLAVTKTVDTKTAKEIFRLGVADLAENRVQAFLEKYEALGDRPTWHLIGHLQTNKVKYVIGKVGLIHSVDSVHLAEEISRRSLQNQLVSDILLEVNVSGEESKYGIRPEETETVIEAVSRFAGIRVCGLMTIAPKTDQPDTSRKYFCRLREIFVDIQGKKYDNIHMKHLSMGMSGDYEAAILEGATMVRIGSALFSHTNSDK